MPIIPCQQLPSSGLPKTRVNPPVPRRRVKSHKGSTDGPVSLCVTQDVDASLVLYDSCNTSSVTIRTFSGRRIAARLPFIAARLANHSSLPRSPPLCREERIKNNDGRKNQHWLYRDDDDASHKHSDCCGGDAPCEQVRPGLIWLVPRRVHRGLAC